MRMAEIENTIIVGSGPAGYTAALYTARANLAPLVIEGFAWGGLLQQTTDVENYPGFPEGIMGPALMGQLRAQAERFGARLETDQAERVELARGSDPTSDSDPAYPVHSVWVGDTEHRARTVILAMGAEHKRLGVPGEEELGGRGVSYCATCDAAFFKGAPTIIVGGGDSAMEEAIFLSKFAEKVTVVHRREEFRASKIMLERARERENIELLTPYTVKELRGGESGALGHAVLLNADTGEERDLDISGAFIAIGHEPQSELVRGQIDLDENGYVVTEGRSTRTNLPGVFAAGDLVDHTYRQAITAAGSGCQAALDAEWYIRDTPHVPVPAGMPLGDPAEAQWAPAAE
jgi:thioredoxin reductase (NADPH)